MPTRLNYTKRKKLTSHEVSITILPNGDDPAAFEVEFDLRSLQPGANDARVFVEAYQHTTRMRFDYGTVAAISPPALESRRLQEFESWEQVRFRVKVTDVNQSVGRLVAWRNQIKPKGPRDHPEDDLVHFKNADLEGLVWDLEFDEDLGPVVLIDRAAGDRHEVGRDDAFIAAVYPEILRRTLTKAFIDEKQNGDDEEHWSYLWLQGFLVPKLGMTEPPSLDDDLPGRLQWIDEAVALFARSNCLSQLWSARIAEIE